MEVVPHENVGAVRPDLVYHDVIGNLTQALNRLLRGIGVVERVQRGPIQAPCLDHSATPPLRRRSVPSLPNRVLGWRQRQPCVPRIGTPVRTHTLG
jgi:hypothetical protein